MITTLTLIGAICLAFYVYLRITYRFADKIPTAQPTTLLFGHGLEFSLKNSYQIFNILKRIYENNRSRIFKLNYGPVAVVCPTHPDLIQKVLVESASMDKPFVYGFLRVDLGLLTAKYDIWKSHRKVLNPSFNTRILNSFIPIFNDCVAGMIQRIKQHRKPGQYLNILEFTTPCTMDMICRTSLGDNVLERDGVQEFLKGIETILHNIGLRMLNADLFPDWVYRFTRCYRDEMSARKYCYAFTDKIIKEKQEELGYLKKSAASDDNNNNGVIRNLNEDEDDTLSYKKPQIFIDQLMTVPLPDGRPFSHAEITDHIYTIIVTGSETSATQVAHTVLLIAMHPEVQDKAVAEIKQLFPTPDTEVCPDILKRLVYMEQIIKEAQRLYPVAAIYGRKTRQDLQLDEFVIPKGNILLMNTFILHRQKEFWGEDAELFDPDRFLPENSKNRHPFAYLPFSTGTRACIGSRYAMMSMKIILLELLRNFKLTTDLEYGKMEFKFRVAIHLACEHRIFLEHRNLYSS